VIKSQVRSFHATLATLAVFGAYAYRNLWPSITFAYSPADGHEGWLLWAKIALAAVGGIAVPMSEPYSYIPLDPAVSSSFPIHHAFETDLCGLGPAKGYQPGADRFAVVAPYFFILEPHHLASEQGRPHDHRHASSTSGDR
jgi:hypothetical protein